MTGQSVSFSVNGTGCVTRPRAGFSLLGCLRGDLGLTGAKQGCGAGDCGACTVVLDGVAVQSCQVPVSALDGADVRTIEALVQTAPGNRVAAALIAAGAAQCGYCLPGIVASATAALARDGAAADLETALGRNLCRCGTQHRILTALRRVRDDMAGAAP